jgi:hypothetical protein
MRKLFYWETFLENRNNFGQDMNPLNEGVEEDFLASNTGTNPKTGEEQKLTPEIFSKIKEMFAEYGPNIWFWFAKRINDGSILDEDLDDWVGHLNTFYDPKNKRMRDGIGLSSDIARYQDPQAVRDLLNGIVKIQYQIYQATQDVPVDSSDDYLGQTEITRLGEIGVKYHGIVEGYQLFEVDSTACSWTPAQWGYYKKTLGQYSAAGQPNELLNICTFQSIEQFKDYLCKQKPGSRYWLLYNKSDFFSPYQFGYEHGQFHNRKNQDVLELINKN